MKEEEIETIDLLKIDIEGSELELFRSEACGKWMRRVKNLAIELHDPDCAIAFLGALGGFQYVPLQSGELQICLNIEPATIGGKQDRAGNERAGEMAPAIVGP